MERRTDEPHPDCQAVLQQARDELAPPAHTLTVTGARRLRAESRGDAELDEPVGATRDLLLPGPDGNDLPVRVYVPEGEGPFPVLVWAHGGGFVFGDLDSEDPTCRILTNETRSVVVSVDYRLSPEHTFPAAVRDCYAATRWAVENAPTIEGDPDRVAVGGQSAGGTIAAVVSLMFRDRGTVADLRHQVLVYPKVDRTKEHDSYEELSDVMGPFVDVSRWFTEQHLEYDLDAHHPYASPLVARDPGGLPPATVLTAGFDVLRDEGIAYAERLEASGVDVTHRHYPDMIHGFFGRHTEPKIERGREAIADVAADLRESFDGRQ